MRYLNIYLEGFRYLCVTDDDKLFFILGRTGKHGDCHDHGSMQYARRNH